MKANSELRSVIAKRQLQGERPSQIAVLRIGKPRKEPSGDWYCPYEISGIGLQGVRKARGIDGLQALLMAIEAARTTLDEHESEWTWEGGEEGESGIPRLVPTFYGKEFARRMGDLIDRELEEFARQAEARHQVGD